MLLSNGLYHMSNGEHYILEIDRGVVQFLRMIYWKPITELPNYASTIITNLLFCRIPL